MLDVGGGPGYFADAFRGAGATYVGLEPDAGEMAARGEPEPGTLRASGEALPMRTGAVDVCYSSNVLEHVRRPGTMADEMVRVTRPGGMVFLSFTPWLSPQGGHETAPWHYLGGHRARRRYVRRNGPSRRTGSGSRSSRSRSAAALRWARACPDAELVAACPGTTRGGPPGSCASPALREIVCWNLVLVLRKRLSRGRYARRTAPVGTGDHRPLGHRRVVPPGLRPRGPAVRIERVLESGLPAGRVRRCDGAGAVARDRGVIRMRGRAIGLGLLGLGAFLLAAASAVRLFLGPAWSAAARPEGGD